MDKFNYFLKRIFIHPFTWYFSLPVKRKLKIAVFTCGIIIILLALVPFGFYYAVSTGLFGKMPSDKELLEVKSYQASEVYSCDSVLLGRYFVENRSEAMYDEIPQHLIDALLATEDARFYEHKGVDTRSLMRVLFKSVILKQGKGGGSTLSQQLAKNIFKRRRYGKLTMPVNKVREAIIANQLENLYSKKEILMLYLNTVSFGEDTYGIKTASQRFFSVDPKKLKVEQAAVLIGMLKAPSAYNPRTNPEKSLERRNVVLQQMEKYGHIKSKALDSLHNIGLALKYKKLDQSNGLAPYFREKIRSDLEKWLKANPKADGSIYNLYTDGLVIRTTVHSKLQKFAEDAVIEHLREMQGYLYKDLRANSFFKNNYSVLQQEIKRSARYKNLQAQGMKHKDIMTQLQKKGKMWVYSHWGEIEKEYSPIDSIRESLITLQVGFLVTNPHNGEVLAWVGGPSYKNFQYDHIVSKRQVGSVFKPIVYARALMDGKRPCDYVSNQQVTYSQYEDWSPQNSDKNYEGKYSLAGALTNSVNTISVKLCMESGIHKVTALAKTLGVESDLPEKPSLALGTANISLEEMTNVYSVFANQGKKTELITIKSVTDKEGKEIFKSKSVSKQVMAPEIAENLTNMLRSVVDQGTAHDLRDKYKMTGAIAGKTGTTQDHRDAWFMGYTPKWVAGVWVGADNPSVHFAAMEYGKGARLAMPIWAKFYQKVASSRSTAKYIGGKFNFENTIDCELYKEDGFLQKIFKRKHKTNDHTGLEDSTGTKKKKRFRLFRKQN